ncbi:unnamed protein product [Pelagomonas calceolata]|uniref:Tetratricopeptide repeat protein n=1 Tax=Pelagomonas calceolata TaxID=35677 RepID=A0A8J2SMQ5_9STRA|nr:unnamed protein product [Pelagomonas calceolata]
MRATEHAPRDPFRVLERRHGLADIVERGAVILAEALLSLHQRLGLHYDNILALQSNLANTYAKVGRIEEAMRMRRDVYSERLKRYGEETRDTLIAANNYAGSLGVLRRFEEVIPLFRKVIPVARRVLGDGDEITLKMRKMLAAALFVDPAATLDDVREAVTTLEETARTARRVMGGAHPLTTEIEATLLNARAALRAREETQPSPGSG